MDASKGRKNLIWGIAAQIITIGVGLFIPRLVLINLGSESNGLLSSIGSILSYMSLLEAGVGTATIQALYKPFANDDYATINGIMSATNHFYKRTGTIYLIIVILLSICYTLFLKTTVPKISVFLVVILSGFSGVLNYFFQGKYKLLLMAEGKNYIITNVSTTVSVFSSIAKVIILANGGDVIALQSAYFIFNLLQMGYFVTYINRHYKWLDLSVDPDFQAISQKDAVLVHQIAELVFNNTDVAILTLFTSLSTISVYSMYAMIFGMVKAIAVTFSDSYSYALGQSYHIKERFDRLYNAYEVYNMAFTFAFFCIAGILMMPFLSLYTAGVHDISYIDWKVLYLFLAVYLLQNGRKASQTVINIAQHFEQTKWRAVLETTINLTVSFLLAMRIGIYGVLIGSIAALFYRTNDVIIYASKLLKRSPLISYGRWLANLVVFIAITYSSGFFDLNTDSYFMLLFEGVVVSSIVIPTFLAVNSLLSPSSARLVFNRVRSFLMAKHAETD